MRILTVVFAILLLNVSSSLSQSCLPEGVRFWNQQQVDNFQINYPGCTEILGNVTIDSNLIDNVLGLSILTSIDGNLKIQGTRMTKLSGLDQLSAVGGRMCLYFPRMLNSLTGLESLEGLHNVETIGSNIIIQGNEALTDISALGNLTAINGYFSVWNNDALPHFTGIDY